MLDDKSIRISIVEPVLEALALQALAESGMTYADRYLDPDDIPLEIRSQTLLVTSALTLRTKSEFAPQMGFSAMILIDEKNVSGLIERINEIYHSKNGESSELAPRGTPFVIGVLPRVGATTIQDIVEREGSGAVFAFRMQPLSTTNQIFCSEIDDFSLSRLFPRIEASQEPRGRVAIVINKIPETASARGKFKALGRELQAFGVGLVCPLFFDSEIQVSGFPSKRMVRDARPLFDWIAKAN